MNGKCRHSLFIEAIFIACLAILTVLPGLSVFDAMAQDARVAQATPPGAPGLSANSQPMTLDAPATVHAFFATDLFAKESGYVLQIDADIGDHVKAGQVLAVIDNPELQKQFVKSEAAERQAGAALEVAKRRVSGMEADLALQEVTLKRQEQLFAGRAVTQQQLDEQRAKQSVSKASLEVGRADIALAEANLSAATAEKGRLQALLQYTKIVAPFDGVVTRRLINPGDLVQAATANRPTTPLFTCQKIDVVRVFADVPEASATAIRPGWPAQVRLYGPAAQTIAANVTRIAAALDPSTRTMRVEIDLPNPDEKLLPGMYAQVTFSPPSAESDAPHVGRRATPPDGG
jgi:multidrug efflux pump subunit AcrA (membrane-fusion protein)